MASVSKDFNNADHQRPAGCCPLTKINLETTRKADNFATVTRNQIIATWLSFTISALRRAAGWSVPQVIRLDREHGLIHVLADKYEWRPS
ncbi:MAG: hypothetical protein LBD30_09055, partial [Verrucomicrobiales bacterium]|nr:hypothetical protein [Verrucomicrobiales bacterium]